MEHRMRMIEAMDEGEWSVHCRWADCCMRMSERWLTEIDQVSLDTISCFPLSNLTTGRPDALVKDRTMPLAPFTRPSQAEIVFNKMTCRATAQSHDEDYEGFLAFTNDHHKRILTCISNRKISFASFSNPSHSDQTKRSQKRWRTFEMLERYPSVLLYETYRDKAATSELLSEVQSFSMLFITVGHDFHTWHDSALHPTFFQTRVFCIQWSLISFRCLQTVCNNSCFRPNIHNTWAPSLSAISFGAGQFTSSMLAMSVGPSSLAENDFSSDLRTASWCELIASTSCIDSQHRVSRFLLNTNHQYLDQVNRHEMQIMIIRME